VGPSDGTDRLAGVILGTAVGDALGLPRENLSPRRARRLFGPPPLRHRFVLGRGMTSDDTEHTCLVAQALLRQPRDAQRFARSLAWGLRWWLLGLPAGTGRATLRATLKLWLGFPPARSGVFSAGNGPAMRSALLGVCLGHDLDRLRDFVRVSTRLTHTDPRAERGALLVALAVHHGPSGFFARAREVAEGDTELAGLLTRMEEHLARGSTAAELADALGLSRGVTGYIYHSGTLALYGWLRHPDDFRAAVEEVIDLGGDADSTGAIAGAVSGACLGAEAIPEEWVRGLWEWPRSVAWMRALAGRLAEASPEGQGRGALPLFWPGLLPRNLLFLGLVLLHVGRRVLPPY
jgi:ADP-ribosyl-[dinitrogen reductase] hydrolase